MRAAAATMPASPFQIPAQLFELDPVSVVVGLRACLLR
jgi:hypothetical protein